MTHAVSPIIALRRLDRLALNRQEVASMLGVSPSTVTRMVEANEIPYVRLRGSLRFPRKALEDWLDAISASA